MKKIVLAFLVLILFINAGYSQQPQFKQKNALPADRRLPPRVIKQDTPVRYVSVATPTTASVSLRQSLTVTTSRIYPEWVAGDRDFFGHGPDVQLKVTLTLSVDGAQLDALIEMTAKEVGGDRTEARIAEKRTLAYAPRGRRFNRIITGATSGGRYTDSNYGLDYINPFSSTGPVKRFVVKGDTDGMDVGNNTEDDCFLNVEFNKIDVETVPLDGGVREIELPLSTISGQLRSTFVGTVGHINNFGPCRNGGCLLERNSFVKFPDAIMRDTIWFPLREIYTNARHYYFSDINLRNITCAFNGNYLNAQLNFESDGAELVGKCANDLGSFDAGCAIGTPSAQLNDLIVVLGLKLIVRNGKLTYEMMDIQPALGSHFSVDCGILDWLCGEVFKDSYQSSIYGIAHNLRYTMANDGFVTQVADALTPKVIDAINAILAFRRDPNLATALVDVSFTDRNLLVRFR
jgi:hypothetical protein